MNGAPIHHSLTRPNMIMGCDRELYLCMIVICALFLGPGGIMKGSIPAIIMGVLLWIVGQRALAAMGKKDARLRHAYIRSLKYKNYYPASSRIDAKEEIEYGRW